MHCHTGILLHVESHLDSEKAVVGHLLGHKTYNG